MQVFKTASSQIAELFSSTNMLIKHYIDSIRELQKAYEDAMSFFTKEDIFNPDNVSIGIEKLVKLRNASGNIILLTGSFVTKETTEIYEALGEALAEEKPKKKKFRLLKLRREKPFEIKVNPKEVGELKTVIDKRIDEAIDYYISQVYKVRELGLSWDKPEDKDELQLIRAEILEKVGKAISDAFSYGIASLRAVANNSVIRVLQASISFVKTMPKQMVKEQFEAVP